MAGVVRIAFTADTASAIKGMKGVERQAGSMAKGFNAAKGLLAGGLVVGGVATLKSWVSNAADAAKASRILGNQISNLGASGRQAFAGADKFANDFGQTIGRDDDDIRPVLSKLASFPDAFRKGSLGAEAMRRGTQAAFDLEALGIGDAQSNILQIGKALNDPIKGMSALTKSGVSFSAEQQKQIANYVKQGNLASAQKVLLAGIESNAKGAATVAVTPWQKVKVGLANIGETLGGTLLPALSTVADTFNTKFVPVLTDFIDRHAPALQQFFSGLAVDLGDVDPGNAEGAFQRIAGKLDGIRVSLTTLRPALVATVPALKVVGQAFVKLGADSITVGGVALKFFADHVNLLVKLMPLLVAAFIAQRAAQAASNVAAVAHVPLQAAQIVGNQILAASNRQLAAAITLQTGATEAGTGAVVQNRIAVVAGSIAQGAASAASKVAAAAQWLFNASLLGCPIVWIIVGIVAVIAIVVLLVRNWGRVREALALVWDKIKEGFAWLRTNWVLIAAILAGPLAVAVLLITRHFDSIVGFFTGLPGRIAHAVHGLFDPIANAWRRVLNFMITAWNRLEFSIPPVDTHIPGVGAIGGITLSTPNIPQIPALARGGIVTSPLLALVGEAGPEAVVPLDRLGGNTYQITVMVAPGADPAEVGRQTVQSIEAYERRSGRRRLVA